MKKFVCGLLVGVLGTGIISVGAAGIWDNISVLRNDISVIVNGENITADNFVYNDTTYLPIRAVSEALNQPVSYDENSNTAYIGERNDNTVIKSKYIPPMELQDGLLAICENGVYYIFFQYIIDMAEKNDIKIDIDSIINSEFKTLTINGQCWDMILFYGRSYIPYDTYVDEIEPLLK